MNLKFILVLIFGLLLTSCVNVLKLSDLRPKDYNFPNDQTKAEKLMKEMGIAHKIDLWDDIYRTIKSLSKMSFLDSWVKGQILLAIIPLN